MTTNNKSFWPNQWHNVLIVSITLMLAVPSLGYYQREIETKINTEQARKIITEEIDTHCVDKITVYRKLTAIQIQTAKLETKVENIEKNIKELSKLVKDWILRKDKSLAMIDNKGG